MAQLTYKIIKHDGGWAYQVDETISEPFATHDAARQAAELAAREQSTPGDSATITYEDEQGNWHVEKSSGTDRPKVNVRG
ncbi:MAG: hypothetical protein ABI616_05025 [Pseudomonadota bacterium]